MAVLPNATKNRVPRTHCSWQLHFFSKKPSSRSHRLTRPHFVPARVPGGLIKNGRHAHSRIAIMRRRTIVRAVLCVSVFAVVVVNLAISPPTDADADAMSARRHHYTRGLLEINQQIQTAFTQTYKHFGWGGDGGGSGAGSSVHFTVPLRQVLTTFIMQKVWNVRSFTHSFTRTIHSHTFFLFF